ncbi:hypothetical protein PHSY_004414 [Pseudozyma hubeiensis SY62]|uniref:Uncharacterized protein n=1 Tax=Pseudozyma hubeiensis (strain SY62) TaxID=1305764 RepID=R9PFJ9_PSEHS|nr:hypothetical protein PHSY_004414 [Pseudozyma hubeiensis SY62]GAC96830.1 hypothetical protein PHSY_004414 [Pseudozyma hubeiensis SY62]
MEAVDSCQATLQEDGRGKEQGETTELRISQCSRYSVETIEHCRRTPILRSCVACAETTFDDAHRVKAPDSHRNSFPWFNGVTSRRNPFTEA